MSVILKKVKTYKKCEHYLTIDKRCSFKQQYSIIFTKSPFSTIFLCKIHTKMYKYKNIYT